MLESLYKHYQFLTTIPGVDRIVAWHLIVELGTDLSVFPDADHCASWAGLVPGENDSAGKKKSMRCRKGNRFLRRVLAQAAWACSRCKTGYLRAFFYSIKARNGWAKAIMATAHKIFAFAFQMLYTNTPFQDLEDDYFDRVNPNASPKTHQKAGITRVASASFPPAIQRVTLEILVSY
jgi:transposase